MSGKALAALAYLPVPGLGLALTYAAPDDRLVRFHGLQGGWLGVLLVGFLVAVGSLGGVLAGATMPLGLLAGVGLAIGLACIVRGMAGAARGTYPALPWLWPLCRLGPGRLEPPASPARRAAPVRRARAR